MLAARHRLPLRHLESVQQALVRDGIPKGIRGPRGSYQLARDSCRVTAEDILRAAGNVEVSTRSRPDRSFSTRSCFPHSATPKMEFGVAPNRINLQGMTQQAEKLIKYQRPARGDRRRRRTAFTVWTLSAQIRLRVKFARFVLAKRRHGQQRQKGHAGHDPDQAGLRLSVAGRWIAGGYERRLAVAGAR